MLLKGKPKVTQIVSKNKRRINKRKWHIQNERSRERDVTREERMLKLKLKTSQLAQQLDNHTCFTMLIGMKGNYTTKEK